MSQTSALEHMLRRDRFLVVAGLVSVVVLAWAYVLAGAGMNKSMAAMAMEPMPRSASYALLMFAMWWIMMIVMMVPSAAPTVLLFSAIRRKQQTSANPTVGAGIFLTGYLVAWAAFSLVATLAQWGLERVGLLSMAMTSTSSMLGGTILLAAGLYQFTPIKTACLRHCQNPVLFLSGHWQPGAAGAFRMGLLHGAYCLGCCWFLMALLFFGGVMNLVWIAGLALYVALEKLLPNGHRLGHAAGGVLVFSGVLVLARAF